MKHGCCGQQQELDHLKHPTVKLLSEWHRILTELRSCKPPISCLIAASAARNRVATLERFGRTHELVAGSIYPTTDRTPSHLTAVTPSYTVSLRSPFQYLVNIQVSRAVSRRFSTCDRRCLDGPLTLFTNTLQ